MPGMLICCIAYCLKVLFEPFNLTILSRFGGVEDSEADL